MYAAMLTVLTVSRIELLSTYSDALLLFGAINALKTFKGLPEYICNKSELSLYCGERKDGGCPDQINFCRSFVVFLPFYRKTVALKQALNEEAIFKEFLSLVQQVFDAMLFLQYNE